MDDERGKLVSEDDDGGLRKVTSYYKTRTKITTGLIKTICSTIEDGNYAKTACAAAGVTRTTYDRWLNQAKVDFQNGESTIYTQFADNVEQALARAEVALVSEIRDGDRGWQGKAWVLERTRNDMFGVKQVTEHKVEMTRPQLPPPPRSHEEMLKRRAERAKVNGQILDAVVVEEV
jgi:hypothetical protein